MALRKTLVAVAFLLFGFGFSACKQEGCTDEKALNYAVTAAKDDGTCLYCKTTLSTGDTIQKDYIDAYYYSGNPYYNQPVISMKYYIDSELFNSSECGTNNCRFKLVLTNKTPKKLTGNFNFNFSGASTVYQQVVLEPYQTIDYSNLFKEYSVCNFTVSQGSFSLYATSSITYQ